MKLPKPLGIIIYKKYKEQVITPQLDNIATKIKFIIDQLVEKCTEMQIVKQLKEEYSFGRNIYTPQRYDKNEPKNRRDSKRLKGNITLKEVLLGSLILVKKSMFVSLIKVEIIRIS